MSPDIAASVRSRLLANAKQEKVEFELFLTRYAGERFLYRLGRSELREQCILKGGALLALWMHDPYRATRDLDLLASGPSDEASVREIIIAICGERCREDGLRFDLTSLTISPIRADQEYEGQRAVLRAYLGAAQIKVQVDFGFGDAVSPGPEDVEYPTLLEGLPPARLRVYPREVSIAEKFEAMVELGRRNTRMKDFHDIWALSSTFPFVGPVLRQAIVACFERRGTMWSEEVPEPLGSAFYGDVRLEGYWSEYLRAGAFRAKPPASFAIIGDRVLQFLGPVRESVIMNDQFGRRWQPGGPWQ